MRSIPLGQVVTCAETGKQFVAASDGFTFNYAQDDAGKVYSDEGVDLREKKYLKDRTTPFVGYLSSDGRSLTGWKGNVLGHVTHSHMIRLTRWSSLHGRTIMAVRIRDCHGAMWYGRGNAGIAIRLRACKT